MAYMSVLSQTDTRLQLLRGPQLLSKLLLGGVLAGPAALVLFGADSIISTFLIAYGLFVVVFSSALASNYEICDIDKESGDISLVRMHWSQNLIRQVSGCTPAPYVTVKLSEVTSVSVEDQVEGKQSGPRQVALRLSSGVFVGITEVFTTDSQPEFDEVVKIISQFINIKSQPTTVIAAGDSVGVDNTDIVAPPEAEISSSDSEVDDDFEQITKEDVADFTEDIPNTPPTE